MTRFVSPRSPQLKFMAAMLRYTVCFDFKSENQGLVPHIFNEFVWKRVTGKAEMSEMQAKTLPFDP